MAEIDKIKKTVKKIVDVVKSIPPICKNCNRGTITEEDGVLECSFCKNPKK